MSSSLNKAILVGNLEKDPEIIKTAEQKEVVLLSLVTSEHWKDRNTGEKREKDESHKIMVAGDSFMEMARNYLKTGVKIYIEGPVHTRKWTDQVGNEKYSTEVVLQNFNSSFMILNSSIGSNIKENNDDLISKHRSQLDNLGHNNFMNKVFLIGNLGKDPEIRQINEGKEIAVMTLATSEHWRDKATGERRDKTEWHRVVVFNDGLVKVIKDYVKKGQKLYLEGALQTRKWLDNSGQEKHSTEVILQNASAVLIMLDSKNSNSSARDKGYQKNNDFSYDAKDDDEIPF